MYVPLGPWVSALDLDYHDRCPVDAQCRVLGCCTGVLHTWGCRSCQYFILAGASAAERQPSGLDGARNPRVTECNKRWGAYFLASQHFDPACHRRGASVLAPPPSPPAATDRTRDAGTRLYPPPGRPRSSSWRRRRRKRCRTPAPARSRRRPRRRAGGLSSAWCMMNACHCMVRLRRPSIYTIRAAHRRHQPRLSGANPPQPTLPAPAPALPFTLLSLPHRHGDCHHHHPPQPPPPPPPTTTHHHPPPPTACNAALRRARGPARPLAPGAARAHRRHLRGASHDR